MQHGKSREDMVIQHFTKVSREIEAIFFGFLFLFIVTLGFGIVYDTKVSIFLSGVFFIRCFAYAVRVYKAHFVIRHVKAGNAIITVEKVERWPVDDREKEDDEMN